MKKNTFFSILWRNPRGQWGVILIAGAVTMCFFGAVSLLGGPSLDTTTYFYLGGGCFFVGALLAWETWHADAGGARLTGASPVSRGQIVRIKKDWLSDAYALHYSFKDAVGRSYRGKKLLSQQEAYMWREGEAGGVRYDARNPTISVWIGRGVTLDDLWGTASATVIDLAPGREADGSNHVLVRYRYRDQLGATHEDQFVSDVDTAYRVGDAGTVGFDPRQPGSGLWLGKTDAGSDDVTAAMSPAPRVTTLTRPPAAKPSTFRLIRRSKPIKNAMLLLVYVFITAFFLLIIILSQLIFSEEPASLEDAVFVALYAVMFLGLVAWFATSLWKGTREVSEWRRILDRGHAVEGTVHLVEEKRQQLGRWTWKPGWVVSYHYRDGAGTSHTGASGYLSHREADHWRSRDKCTIIYDPAQPSKSVWVGQP